jgi:enamine deaminase RidA (YjgF/YER057c/UK114 family)
VKLLVFVNGGPHFTEAHMVAKGASELFIEVFEERGARARSALGVSQIPFGCCVEVEMVVETFVSESEFEL